MSILSLFLGIISILLSLTFFTFIGPILGVIAGGIGIILAVAARKKSQQDPIVTAALITSIFGAILNIILSLTCMACLSGAKFVGEKVMTEMQKSDMDANKIQSKVKKQFDDAFKEAKKSVEKKSEQEKKDKKDSEGW